jgi:PAS domain S-box-containing protein
MLELCAEAVIATDEQERITLFNEAAETIFGHTAAEALGEPLEILIPERFRESHHQHIAHFARAGQKSRRMAARQKVLGLRKNGTEFHMSASISQQDISGQKVFTVICNDISEQVMAEEQLRRSHDELEIRIRERTADLEDTNASLQAEILERKRAEEEIQDLSRKMMRVQEEERRNLARELHDGATQNLVTLCLNLSQVTRQSTEDVTRSAIEQCIQLAEQCTTELRTLSYLLHPPLLDEMGLRLTLTAYVEGFSQRTGVTVTLQTSGQVDGMEPEVELAVFRIVQEGLSNIHRHSRSRTAQIILSREQEELTLQVSDQGRGISSGSNTAGVGLASMKERTRLLGGTLDVKTGPIGTTITAVLPVKREQERAVSA